MGGAGRPGQRLDRHDIESIVKIETFKNTLEKHVIADIQNSTKEVYTKKEVLDILMKVNKLLVAVIDRWFL